MDVSLVYPTYSAGGSAVAKVHSAATTNATAVKAKEGRVIGWSLANTTVAFKYVRLYNKATAPTVGTDVPFFVIPLPPNSCICEGDISIAFGTGIAYAITGALADNDATVTAAGDVIGAIFYA